jgi:endoglucanase
VVAVIRENDPDNIIIIGSPDWSKEVDVAAADPVEGTNLMYTLHFYAGSHGQELRDKMDTAQDQGLALFVTEWGTTDSSGSGALYFEETDVWLDYLDEHMISWCNWSIGSSIAETSNTLKMASSVLTQEEKLLAHWPDSFITKSGKYVRSQLLGIPYTES